MDDIKLYTPWYSFANQIKYTYGLSPYITVNELVQDKSKYILVINVSNNAVATALRKVLPISKEIYGTTVEILIFNSYGELLPVSNEAYTPRSLAKVFCNALYRNPLFVGTIITDDTLSPLVKDNVGNVVMVIESRIVKFYNDDDSNLCSNYTEVAAKVFTLVTNRNFDPDLTISFSTYDRNCKLQRNLYYPSLYNY